MLYAFACLIIAHMLNCGLNGPENGNGRRVFSVLPLGFPQGVRHGLEQVRGRQLLLRSGALVRRSCYPPVHP
jgi:hypothetical protein